MGPDSPQHILRPVRLSTILLSFLVALLLNFLPWKDLRYVPDFVALVLCFWCVRQPRMVGIGAGFILGLLMDAGNGVHLGQHALAYCLLAFLSLWLSRRILWFRLPQQMLHIAVLLIVSQAVVLLVRVSAGGGFPGWAMFVGPFIGALLWPVLAWLLLMPQRRLERDGMI